MKAIYALIGASGLMIILGIYLISQEQQVAEQNIPPANEPPAQKRDIGVIPTLEERERDSEIPQIEVNAERGSEQWCEQMMVLADDKWSREDSQTFADECIYE